MNKKEWFLLSKRKKWKYFISPDWKTGLEKPWKESEVDDDNDWESERKRSGKMVIKEKKITLLNWHLKRAKTEGASRQLPWSSLPRTASTQQPQALYYILNKNSINHSEYILFYFWRGVMAWKWKRMRKIDELKLRFQLLKRHGVMELDFSISWPMLNWRKEGWKWK